MTDKGSQPIAVAFDSELLRGRAMERLRGREDSVATLPASDLKTLLHELDVYQIELEVQNEDLKNTQIRLSKALERYQDLFQRAPSGYLILDGDRTVIDANRAAVQLCALEREELQGQRMEQLVVPEDREKVSLLFRRVAESRRLQSASFQIARPQRWVHLDAMLQDESQHVMGGFRVALADITARKEVEAQLADSVDDLRATQAELLRRERLAALGQLAGSVAHELRSPLTIIRNGLFFLEHSDLAGAAIQEVLAEMKRAVTSSDHIVAEMLDYVREPVRHASIFPIGRAITEAMHSLPLPAAVRLLGLVGDDIEVNASRDQITRILLNLLQNAVQAMPHGGELEVRAERGEDGQVCILVRDTGCGIPEENMEKVFEPLFSTKVKGIGLGLAIAQRYAELNSGRLAVESEPGRGTTFRLFLEAGERQ